MLILIRIMLETGYKDVSYCMCYLWEWYFAFLEIKDATYFS